MKHTIFASTPTGSSRFEILLLVISKVKFQMLRMTLLAAPFLLPSPVYAQLAPDKPPTLCVLETVFIGLLNFALGFAGLALLVMFIMNGYKWLTAGTNEKGVQEARLGLTYAILGMALMFGAWFILILIRQFTGIDVTVFRIPGCEEG